MPQTPNKKSRGETARLISMYDAMLAALGPQHWWPARTQFEVCVGAILTQNTSWTNVEKAIANLRAAKSLNAKSIHDMPHDRLAELIVPSGYYNMKAKRLKNFVSVLVDEYGGSLKRMFSPDVPVIREKLLAINGVGPETADSIILYAAGKPIFVVDAYTKRIGSRHGLFPEDADYETMRMYFTERLAEDVELYNEYHALLVAVGNGWCSRKPGCAGCPLQNFIPRQ